ncbi:MAG: uracil-DNA glycosylase, partial [Silvibacterium sp.]
MDRRHRIETRGKGQRGDVVSLKMTPLTSELGQAIQARVRYYRDLGIHDFYRRCEPEQEIADLESVSVTNIEPELPIPARRTPPPPFQAASAESIPVAERTAALQAIREDIGDCTRCPLAFQGRHTIVFGDGDPNARLMFIGEGPGADEDMQGLPFVGRAGQLLNNMIAAMGLKRAEVYIANIVKCRPPQNRVPEPEEANTCTRFLFRQIEVIRPQVIVALGATAATYLLGGKSALARLRGRLHEARGAKLIVTYH